MKITRFIAANGLGRRHQVQKTAREQAKNKSYAASKVACNPRLNDMVVDRKGRRQNKNVLDMQTSNSANSKNVYSSLTT